MSTEKIAFIDVETTGTDHIVNGIIQLSAIIQIDGETVATIDRNIKPFPEDKIEDEALEVTGYSREDLESFDDPSEVYEALTSEFEEHIDKYDSDDKFHFVGYNAYFDSNFVRQWFRNNDDPYYGSYFFYPAIDVMQLVALMYMKHRHKFPDYKLMTVCDKVGMDIDEDKAHDAFYDIECTMKLFNAVRDTINWNNI